MKNWLLNTFVCQSTRLATAGAGIGPALVEKLGK